MLSLGGKIRNWLETPLCVSFSNNFILSLKFYRTKEEGTNCNWMETVPINRCTSGQLPSIGKDRADVEKEAIGSPNVSRFVEATSHKFFLFLKNTIASHTGYFSPSSPQAYPYFEILRLRNRNCILNNKKIKWRIYFTYRA